MNLSFKKLIAPATGAVVGGLAVLAVLKMNPALQAKLNRPWSETKEAQPIYDDIFKDPFGNRFLDQEDPFEQMRKMQERMEKQMEGFTSQAPQQVSSTNIYDISQREDDKFLYYDIKIDDLNSTSLDAKVENGYVTITGTLEKKNASGGEEESPSSQFILSSKFSRTFPLPENVNADKMQMTSEKGKVVLKFPKLNA